MFVVSLVATATAGKHAKKQVYDVTVMWPHAPRFECVHVLLETCFCLFWKIYVIFPWRHHNVGNTSFTYSAEIVLAFTFADYAIGITFYIMFNPPDQSTWAFRKYGKIKIVISSVFICRRYYSINFLFGETGYLQRRDIKYISTWWGDILKAPIWACAPAVAFWRKWLIISASLLWHQQDMQSLRWC